MHNFEIPVLFNLFDSEQLKNNYLKTSMSDFMRTRHFQFNKYGRLKVKILSGKNEVFRFSKT